MWAAQYLWLEPLRLLSAHWHGRWLEYGWQVFFGGVFDRRVGMLFSARRNEDGNVHRRDGVSKTVTKNTSDGIFKNKKIKSPPENPAFSGRKIDGGSAGWRDKLAVSFFLMELIP